MDFAKKRLQLAETLFYKLLENILRDEMRKPNFDCEVRIDEFLFWEISLGRMYTIFLSKSPSALIKMTPLKS